VTTAPVDPAMQGPADPGGQKQAAQKYFIRRKTVLCFRCSNQRERHCIP